jgi:hypothetical protein
MTFVGAKPPESPGWATNDRNKAVTGRRDCRRQAIGTTTPTNAIPPAAKRSHQLSSAASDGQSAARPVVRRWAAFINETHLGYRFGYRECRSNPLTRVALTLLPELQ